VATIHRQEMSLMIETALGHLPTQQRVAVVLSYYEDRTNSEVAEIMGTSIDAVESLLKRGRQRLRELLRRPGREMGGINI
jgi:RNA polymerase sigma-70 factor (ECF subfamily)